ncbi:arylsulfatase [Coraliomargarita sinensis]|uniref:Arylsulfatase n=1 Tax=Coraliomargarita sinensis TaxID=2174842 RepID=A0A317ZE44_9BACT|nr:arylsulfatase [Coraliomargarita sinensis]PXA03440.1 arylsulfatase [Coraliomargarita sinensis]
MTPFPRLACFLLLGLSTLLGAAPKPNIIIIMSDDMGYSDLGCYGSEIETPQLDELAANGLRYTQFYNTSRCCPTRASLLTGLYAHQAGIGEMTSDRGAPGYRGDLSRNAVTIAEALKPAGYRTYMSGKWHLAKQLKPDGDKFNWPLQRGFDRFYGTIIGAGSFYDPWTLTRGNKAITPEDDPEYQPETFYYTDAISDNAARFINEHDSEEPFFMYVAYTAPHWPLHALEKDIEKYKGRYDDGYEAIRKARYERMKQLGVIQEDWALSPAPGSWSDLPEEQRAWEARAMEVYAAMIDSMDQGIGRIVDALENEGEFENTLILFLHDNGGCDETIGWVKREKGRPPRAPMSPDELQTEMFPTHTRKGQPIVYGKDAMPGPATTYMSYRRNWANVSNTPFREYKSKNHEGGIATPLIAHWPKGIAAKNELRHRPGHLIDLMATCLDLSGAEYPEIYAKHRIQPFEGQSLKASFSKDEDPDRILLFEHYGRAAIRDGNWKLVRLGVNKPWELYGLEKDRSEMNNLVAEHPEKAAALEELWTWHAWRTRIYPKPGDGK